MSTSERNAKIAVDFLHGLATDRSATLNNFCDKEKFVYGVGPKSFGMPERGFEEHFNRPNVVKDLKFEIHRAIGGDDGAAVWCSGTATLLTDNAPYQNEYCWLMDIDKSGKITKVIEFVDSAYTKERFAAAAAAQPKA